MPICKDSQFTIGLHVLNVSASTVNITTALGFQCLSRNVVVFDAADDYSVVVRSIEMTSTRILLLYSRLLKLVRASLIQLLY